MFRRNILSVLTSVALAAGVTAFPADRWRSTSDSSGRVADSAKPANEDLAIIVNAANPADNFSLAQLRSIFLVERAHWPDGQKITVVMRDQGQAERAAILRTICRMSESDFNQYSMHSAFTGQVQTAPKLLSSGAGVRKFVFNVPGAIGYIRAGEVDRSVKAVRLDGRLPGEGGYKLRLEPR